MKFGLWNSQSIRNKTAFFVDYICSNNIDHFALTETWFTDLDVAAKAECIPDGYKMSEQSRSGRRGGGIALVYRSDILVKKVDRLVPGAPLKYRSSHWQTTRGACGWR